MDRIAASNAVTTCLDCKVLPPFSIALCPLHQAAERMRSIIERIAAAGTLTVETVDGAYCAYCEQDMDADDNGHLDTCAVLEARAILRDVEGA